jgi:FixJ family two-component response regulator
MRVYVVDDDPAVTQALAALVRIIGYEVEEFESAEGFLETYRPGGPECLILDMRLPGMSGLDLQRELVRRESSMPVIFITGHGEASDEAEAVKLGAIGFLEKPFRADQLIEDINKALEITLNSEPQW